MTFINGFYPTIEVQNQQHMESTNPWKVIMLGPGLDVQGGVAMNEKLFLEHAPSEVQIHHIATHKDGSVALKILVFVKALGKFIWILSTQKVDLVHIRFSQRGSTFRKAIMTVLAWGFRKPIILQAHASQFHQFYPGLPQWIQQLLRWAFGKCRRFIALSESWKNFYTVSLGLKPEQVVVLYNPVKLPAQVPARSASKQVKLLFLGRIGQRKGAFDLISAFATLPKEYKACSSLIMAGDGEVEQACSLVKSFNLESYIEVLGWVAAEERDALLAKADVFVLPSYNEGLPLSMLEAMSWGLPVIVTPVGGISEVVTHAENGLLVEPGNVEQLSDAIKSLTESNDLRISLGTQARASIAHLDINKYWVSFLDVYRSALESNF